MRSKRSAARRRSGPPCSPAAVAPSRRVATSPRCTRMDERQFADTISRYMRVSAAFRACPKPTVAAIHGYALAGGFELALMCDIRFAAVGAQFGLPDTPLGLSPTSGMTYLLPRIVGLGRALYLDIVGRGHRCGGGRADRARQPRRAGRGAARGGGGIRPSDRRIPAGRCRDGRSATLHDGLESRLRSGDAARDRGRDRVVPVARDEERFQAFVDRKGR